MSHTPESSAIRVDGALEAAIGKAISQSEIEQLLHDAALEQKLVEPDPLNSSVLHPTALAFAAPRTLARTVTVNSTKYILEGATETELLAAETAIYKQLLSQPKVDDTDDTAREQRRDEAGRFVAEQEAAADEATLAAAYQQSWQSATQEFLSRHPEWEGGEAAKTAIGKAVVELGLPGSPTVASLEIAYRELRRTNGIPANPEVRRQREQYDAIAGATSFDEIRRLAGGHPDRGYESDFNWR